MILYILPPTSENKEQKLKIIRWAKTPTEMIVGRRVEYSHFFRARGLKRQEWRDTSQFPLFKTPGKLKALCKIKMSSESMANQAIKSTRNLGHTYKGKSANSMKFEFSLAEWDFLSHFETLWPHAHLSSYKCEKTNTCVDMLSAPLEKYF